MTAKQLSIVPKSREFSHSEAVRVSKVALSRDNVQTFVVDLQHAHDATTSAFARLVLLRGALLKRGRDLLLTGLHDRPASLYEVNLLGSVLPRVEA
jgi:anti-anti-sigma regulatory factor